MKKEVSVPIVAAVVAAAPHWALAQGTDQYGYGPHMMWQGGAMIFGPLFMVLVLALMVAIVVLLVRWLGGPRPGTSSSYTRDGSAIIICRRGTAKRPKETFGGSTAASKTGASKSLWPKLDDAPFHETREAIEAKGILPVEMEAAALYAFAAARERNVVCFVHVTNPDGAGRERFRQGRSWRGDGFARACAAHRRIVRILIRLQ